MTTFDRAVEAGAEAIYAIGDYGLLRDRGDSLKKLYYDQARAAILAALKELRQAEHHMTDSDFAFATWVATLDALIKEAENG